MFGKQKNWVKDLPRSRIEYPDTLINRFKYWFWAIYAHFYPFIRGVLYKLGIGTFIIKHTDRKSDYPGRQGFLIGTIDPARTARDLAHFLVEQGFGNHFVAWKDSGEVASLRRSVGFEHQYHLRIFSDGEIRAHYEYTPEFHPILHLIRIGFEDRREEFLKMLKGWIIPIPAE